ncbi:EAL domain-containing protein [Methylobacterium oryzae]|uniref:EAL domain-containing protein n=1 Tax=Methylobacterium oryzae TaxID=334852 RepID=UPI002F2FC66F
MHDLSDPVTLPAGTVLFEEGAIGHCAYLILSGRIAIFRRRDGGEAVLARRSPGEIFGEMAILDALPRSAGARAEADCVLVPVDAAQIRQRLAGADPILRLCLEGLIARFRETLPRLGPASAEGLQAPPSPSARADFDATVASLAQERALRRALARDEFALFLQPIARLATGRLAGFEALIRWHDPERGLVPPAAFIPAAEANGLILAITAWVIDAIGRILPRILQAGLRAPASVEPSLFVSFNVTAQDLARADIPGLVDAMLRRTGLAPGALKIEVTESALMQDPAGAAAALARCRTAGLGIAVDDFGTGYSSLSHLSTLPITTLKVDRAFVRAMLAEPRDRRIVQTILRLAEEIGVVAVAEGIEGRAEAEALAAMGCALGQGYHFGRPMPEADALAAAAAWNAEAWRVGLSGEADPGRHGFHARA